MTNSNSSGQINPFTGQPVQIGVDSAGRYSKPNKRNSTKRKRTTLTDEEKKEKNRKVTDLLSKAADATGQFIQNRKVDYSSINSSSRDNVAETDLTEPGYSDYFAKDNLQRGYEGPTTT